MAGYKAGRAGGYPHLFKNTVDMDTPAKMLSLIHICECNFSVTHPSLLQSNARDQFPKRYSAPERQALQVGASYYAESVSYTHLDVYK